MNTQEAFDAAVAATIKQGRPSVNELEECLYRGPEGLRCPVGWLIPDEIYDPRMEGRFIDGLVEDWPRLAELLGGDPRLPRLLMELQLAHDKACDAVDAVDFVEEFKSLARTVAYDFGLDPASAR